MSDAALGAETGALQLRSEQVWHALAKASFAVVGHVTPRGDPRSSGVLYKAVDRRLFIVTAPDGWKAKHIAATPRVSVTVPVRRGGLLSLVLPIPPATISFHAAAIVHPVGTVDVPADLSSLVPDDRRASSCIIELVPEAMFVTYGIGVPLLKMRDPAQSRARVPVTDGSGP